MKNNPRFPPMPTAITTGDSGTPVFAVWATTPDEAIAVAAIREARDRFEVIADLLDDVETDDQAITDAMAWARRGFTDLDRIVGIGAPQERSTPRRQGRSPCAPHVSLAEIEEAIGAIEASIIDDEIVFEDITSPEGARDCALETLKQVRDALDVPKIDDGDPRTPAYGVGGGR